MVKKKFTSFANVFVRKPIYYNFHTQTRFYTSALLTTLGAAIVLRKCPESKREMVRLGAAGALSILVTESVFYPLDAVNMKSKAKIGKNFTLLEMA